MTLVYKTPSNSSVTLSAVMALWLGISRATSFKLFTYAMRSRNGMRMARPGSRMRLNFPMRSTIHAVCCGTKRMMVFAGRDGFWKYVVGPAPGGPKEEGIGGPYEDLVRWRFDKTLFRVMGR